MRVARCAGTRRAKQVQSDEYQGLGYAEKWERLAFREQLLLDINECLADPDLSHTQRNRYSVTADKLLHSIAEERGQLPSRSTLDVAFAQTPLVRWMRWLSMTIVPCIPSVNDLC
jgi:hypothetical protein